MSQVSSHASGLVGRSHIQRVTTEPWALQVTLIVIALDLSVTVSPCAPVSGLS